MNDYFYHLAILVTIYLILAQGFNVSFGLGALLNLAHISVYAIGAYTSALLSTEFGYGFLPCMLASAVAGAAFALLVGGISLRLSSDYFAIGTLAFSLVVSAVLINWKEVTRGVLGIPGIPRPDLYSINFYENINFLILSSVICIFVLFYFWIIHKSRLSRSLRAQAELPRAAESLGKNLRAIRNDSFILSSSSAGLAGSLYAYYINYIDPTSFGLHEMVFVLSIVVLGKPGSFWGVIAATIFLVLLPEPLRFLDFDPAYLGPLRQFLYALILFITVYLKKDSLFPRERLI